MSLTNTPGPHDCSYKITYADRPVSTKRRQVMHRYSREQVHFGAEANTSSLTASDYDRMKTILSTKVRYVFGKKKNQTIHPFTV